LCKTYGFYCPFFMLYLNVMDYGGKYVWLMNTIC
jgi:hypothetical protein